MQNSEHREVLVDHRWDTNESSYLLAKRPFDEIVFHLKNQILPINKQIMLDDILPCGL